MFVSAVSNQADALLWQSLLKSNCIGQFFLNVSSLTNNTNPFSFQAMLSNPSTDEVKPEEPTPIPQTSFSGSTDDFVSFLWPKAKAAALQIGLDPKLLLAQVALETGWGKCIAKDVDGSSSNNLFNIKAKAGKSVVVGTTEYSPGGAFKVLAAFRKYSSIEASFSDYVSLIKGNVRYQKAVANAGDPEQYAQALQEAGYATDPNYASKILSIYYKM